MARQGFISESAKKAIVVVLFLVLGVVVIYNILGSSTPSSKKNQTAGQPSPRPTPANSTPPRALGTAAGTTSATADLTPIEFSFTAGGGGSPKVGERGNIFAYWVAPPPPPTPPPPPPPIALQMVQPQSVIAGTPRTFTLSVIARPLPPDARIYIDGSARQSKRVNDTTLSTDIAPSEYGFTRTMNVEVRAQSDPANMKSNPVPLIVQAPPEPPFKYIGRLGDQAIFEMLSTKEAKRKKKGEVLEGAWRIDSFTDTMAEVTLTQYDIKRQMPIQDKGR